MSQRLFRLLILILIALALPMFVWLALPQPPAAAQCGTQASSCKTCHEIQGKLRVSTNGDWHIQHSFGDFCVFCHAGDAKATDKTKAHKSMVKPLENVSASCAACHEADCNTRADKYAKILGVTVGMGSGGPAALPGQGQSPIAESSPPSSDAEEPRNINWGNVTLAALALVLLFGGGGYALWNERQLAGRSTWDKLIGNRPELGVLMPLLAKADPQTVQAITRTLAERSK